MAGEETPGREGRPARQRGRRRLVARTGAAPVAVWWTQQNLSATGGEAKRVITICWAAADKPPHHPLPVRFSLTLTSCLPWQFLPCLGCPCLTDVPESRRKQIQQGSVYRDRINMQNQHVVPGDRNRAVASLSQPWRPLSPALASLAHSASSFQALSEKPQSALPEAARSVPPP